MNNLTKNLFQVRLLSLCIFPILLNSLAPLKATANPLAWQINQSDFFLAQAQEKPRIAVLDFDYSSVSNPGFFSYLPGDAKGVSDLLVNKLVEAGNYRVIERSQLEAILQEQNLGTSGRIDASTAAQIGRILGVEAVIIGTVTQFDLQRQDSGFNVFGIGVGGNDTDAFVKLNIRVVNTTTAEIVATAEGNGNASQSDNQVQVYGIGGGSSTSNEGKLLTFATQQAIDELITQLDTNADKIASLPKSLPTVTAIVADVAGNTVILNKGTSDGYQKGMKISIERTVKEVKDPQTGEVLRQITQPIGTIELSDVDRKSSMGTIISGSSFQVGDIAKPLP